MAADASKDNTADLNPFRDLSKAFEQFRMPGVDVNTFMESRRKDVEALVAANKIAYEALQALARTQTEMLTQTIQESGKGLLAGSAKSGDFARHSEDAQKAWHKMVADMKHLTEMVQKAQLEAMTTLAARAKDSVGEMAGLTRPK